MKVDDNMIFGIIVAILLAIAVLCGPPDKNDIDVGMSGVPALLD